MDELSPPRFCIPRFCGFAALLLALLLHTHLYLLLQNPFLQLQA
jgi:hypothetical protein